MNNPTLWKTVINRLRNANTDNVGEIRIAGGAVRDWLLGVPEKDIDVFVVKQNDTPLVQPRDFTLRMVGEAPPEMANRYESMRNITAISNWQFDGHEIQVIELTGIQTPLETYILNNFDADINLGSYCGRAGLTVPSSTLQDMDEKAVWLRLDNPRAQERAERFVDKMNRVEPGWSILNPYRAPDIEL